MNETAKPASERRFPVAKSDGEIARVLLAFLATAGIFYVNIMPAIVDGLIEGLGFIRGAFVGISLAVLSGMNAEFDTTGQMAALGGFASKMGLASGPAVAALVVGESNYGLVITVATLMLVLCFLVALRPAYILDIAARR